MVAKKSPQANLENKKSIPVFMGFIMVLSLLFIAFEWSKNEFNLNQLSQGPGSTEIVELPPITIPEKIIPPPPPEKISDEIKVIDDLIKPSNETSIVTDATPLANLPDIINMNYTTKSEEDPNVIFVSAEEMPEFKGNVFKYLSENLSYPAIPLEYGIQGRVVCQFVVNKDGSIVDIEVIKGVDKYLDAEAIRVIKSMPNWKPGKMNGKTVRVKYTLPVNFKLM